MKNLCSLVVMASEVRPLEEKSQPKVSTKWYVKNFWTVFSRLVARDARDSTAPAGRTVAAWLDLGTEWWRVSIGRCLRDTWTLLNHIILCAT